MSKSHRGSRGFTLIAALLVMVLLSAVAIGLVYLVTNEGQMSRNEQEDNIAYYAAESGIEKLTADLASLYQTSLSPTTAQIQNLTNYPPTSAMVGMVSYNPPPTITYNQDVNGNPISSWNTVSSGSNQGLFAEIVPLTLTINATRPTGASVNITRNVEVALIPVFQFGVFCGYDCSYFPGPNFSFGGRVHTNGSLYLATGGELVFNDKIAAFTQVVLDRLENGHLTSAGYGGTVYGSTATGGCPLGTFPPVGTNCVAFSLTNPSPAGDASWSGGIPNVGGSPNGTNYGSFISAAAGFNGYLTTSVNGATNLQLPFVQNSCTSNPPPCTDPIQIIRKPVAGELATSSLGQSRLYNTSKAQIRVLIADTQADLHPERGPLADGQDIQFVPNTSFNVTGVGAQFYAMGKSGSNNWTSPLKDNGAAVGTPWPLLGETTQNPGAPDGAWIRVEYQDNAGAWHGVTTEWLGLGFGRAFNTPPTTPKNGAGQNAINPNAVLILQQLQPNLGAGSATGVNSQYNWYPINFYDTREGEARDVQQPDGSCSVNGVMNAVELDVGNLKLWLNGTIGANGLNVNYTNQNGYLLYFSDRRGMVGDPVHGNLTYGESGLEDVVNSASAAGTPDGALEALGNYQYSPEDVDLNGVIDNFGEKNLGYGFGINTNPAPRNQYVRFANCATNAATPTGVGLANMVTGARHVLKLIDGRLNTLGTSALPVRPDNQLGGFTVASENPVYVQGDYNSSSLDPFWTNAASNNTPHAAASIIADSVTLLSNQWSDAGSLYYTTQDPGTTSIQRIAGGNAYYRMAVAGGKNIPFPQPAWGGQDMGTDGGLHNFLRYLEAWGGQTLFYDGSIVSMYYSEYDTGIFKCCTTVYGPPTRKYFFDTLFLNPQNLPPGTPEFQDIVNLSYRQNFAPQ